MTEQDMLVTIQKIHTVATKDKEREMKNIK